MLLQRCVDSQRCEGHLIGQDRIQAAELGRGGDPDRRKEGGEVASASSLFP